MRILHVFDHSAPLQSGYAFRSLAILRAQRSFGWTTAQVTAPRHNATDVDIEEAAGFSFHRTRSGREPLRSLPVLGELETIRVFANRITECAREFRPDIVHAHSPVLDALPALRACRRLGLPLVYEMRSIWEDSLVAKGRGRVDSPRYRATRALETWALRRADSVISISQGLSKEIIERGVPADRIVEVPNGVDLDRFPAERAPDVALAASLGFTDLPVFGYAGSLHAYEGLDLLVDAFGELARTHSRARLLILGDGSEAGPLAERVRECGLGERVRLLGQVPHEEIPRYLSLMSALVYPRRESRLTRLVTPLKPLEAMAQGVPVIASDIGGHRELTRDGETALLVEEGSASALAAAIGHAIDEPGSVLAIAHAARRHVERERTWAITVGRTADAYARAGVSAAASEINAFGAMRP